MDIRYLPRLFTSYFERKKTVCKYSGIKIRINGYFFFFLQIATNNTYATF